MGRSSPRPPLYPLLFPREGDRQTDSCKSHRQADTKALTMSANCIAAQRQVSGSSSRHSVESVYTLEHKTSYASSPTYFYCRAAKRRRSRRRGLEGEGREGGGGRGERQASWTQSFSSCWGHMVAIARPLVVFSTVSYLVPGILKCFTSVSQRYSPEVSFRFTVIGACPVTTDWIFWR